MSPARLQNPQRVQILVVDDDRMNREIAQLLLSNSGLHVDSASNGEESIGKINERDYELILMDMQMPVLDGLEATKRIRNLPNGPKIPILAMTANVFPEDEQRCRAAGMDDFLIKPLEPNDMFGCVLKWLDHRHSGISASSY